MILNEIKQIIYMQRNTIGTLCLSMNKTNSILANTLTQELQL